MLPTCTPIPPLHITICLPPASVRVDWRWQPCLRRSRRRRAWRPRLACDHTAWVTTRPTVVGCTPRPGARSAGADDEFGLGSSPGGGPNCPLHARETKASQPTPRTRDGLPSASDCPCAPVRIRVPPPASLRHAAVMRSLSPAWPCSSGSDHSSRAGELPIERGPARLAPGR